MAIYCMELFDQNIRASIGITCGNAYEGLLKSNKKCVYRLISKSLTEAERMAVLYTHVGILCDESTFEKIKNNSIHGLFYELGKKEVNCGISKYRITCLGAQSEKRGALKRQVQPKIAQEHILKLQQTISSNDDEGERKNILIEGNPGTGKSYTLKRIYKMLERNGFIIWYFELT
jgi:DNA replication protein DnaC